MHELPIVAFDVAAITVLAYGLYFRRHQRRDMLAAYVCLNVGVMAVAMMLANAGAGLGLGLGLFGVLSIIRLRSSEITQQEVAYYFAALAIGLLCGISPDPLWLAPALGSLLVAVMFIVDHPMLLPAYRHGLVTVDAAYLDEEALGRRLEQMLNAEVCSMVVREVDLIKDMTVVDVRYRLFPHRVPTRHHYRYLPPLPQESTDYGHAAAAPVHSAAPAATHGAATAAGHATPEPVTYAPATVGSAASSGTVPSHAPVMPVSAQASNGMRP